jgi:hypothetical protein
MSIETYLPYLVRILAEHSLYALHPVVYSVHVRIFYRQHSNE